MATYGLPGAVEVGGKVIAHMSDWSLEQSREIKEGSFFRGSGKEKTAGIIDWSASCNGRVDFETTSGQEDLLNKFNAGEEITLKLYLNATAYFQGKGIIESVNIDNSAEGEYNIEISIAGSGALTKSVTPTAPARG